MSYFSEVFLKGESGNLAEVNSEGQLHTVMRSMVDAGNSSTTPLLAGATFSGVSHELLDYAEITVSLYTDVDSAVDGLTVEFSSDGISWLPDGATMSVFAGKGKTFSFQPERRYFRVAYTNGAVDQGVFDLETTLHKTRGKPSSHNINKSIVGDDDAELVKAVLTGLAPDGTFKNVKVTNAGNQKISIEEFETGVSSNLKTQLNVTPFHADGTEGVLVTGIKKETGKDGIDSATNTLQTIGYEHHEVHNGSHFNYCDFSLNEGSGAVIEFLLTTPNTLEWTHLVFEVSASEGATIELYEGASGITGGTTITPRNNERNSANASGITLVKDPTTITSDGTRAAGFLAGGGRSAGFVSRSREYVLKQNETYLVRITSLAVSNDIAWCAEWYEHTNKN